MAPDDPEIRLSAGAAAELAELGRRRAGMLTIALARRARARPDPGLVVVETPANLAACEVLAAGGPVGGPTVMLVYAVRSGPELSVALFGPELHRRFERLAVQRLLHRG